MLINIGLIWPIKNSAFHEGVFYSFNYLATGVKALSGQQKLRLLKNLTNPELLNENFPAKTLLAHEIPTDSIEHTKQLQLFFQFINTIIEEKIIPPEYIIFVVFASNARLTPIQYNQLFSDLVENPSIPEHISTSIPHALSHLLLKQHICRYHELIEILEKLRSYDPNLFNKEIIEDGGPITPAEYARTIFEIEESVSQIDDIITKYLQEIDIEDRAEIIEGAINIELSVALNCTDDKQKIARIIKCADKNNLRPEFVCEFLAHKSEPFILAGYVTTRDLGYQIIFDLIHKSNPHFIAETTAYIIRELEDDSQLIDEETFQEFIFYFRETLIDFLENESNRKTLEDFCIELYNAESFDTFKNTVKYLCIFVENDEGDEDEDDYFDVLERDIAESHDDVSDEISSVSTTSSESSDVAHDDLLVHRNTSDAMSRVEFQIQYEEPTYEELLEFLPRELLGE